VPLQAILTITFGRLQSVALWRPSAPPQEHYCEGALANKWAVIPAGPTA
jgi:hypothetical protein